LTIKQNRKFLKEDFSILKTFDSQKMFLSEGCSLRRQITFPKASSLRSAQEKNEENEMIIGFLKELGNN